MWTIIIIVPVLVVLYLLLRKQKEILGGVFRSVAGAIFMGLLGGVVLFAFGSVSGRGEIGVLAAAFFCLLSGVMLVRKYPASMWYGGAVINIPLWIFFTFWADPGQFEFLFWGLAAILFSSYAGTFVGSWLSKRRIVFSRTTKALLVAFPVVMIVMAAYILNAPKPIPPEKNLFVGAWRSASGFELRIMANGEARIAQNVQDRGVDYENLNIKVAPPTIAGANVEFLGDSSLCVVRHGYYAREYRINSPPYPDSNTYTMVLNGVIMVKE
jgi:hypothetical protein